MARADYSGKWQKMLTKLTAKGADVTFRVETPGEHDPLTETWGEPTFTDITGKAAEIPGDPEEYAQLDLSLETVLTILFAPTVYDTAPPVGSTVVWAGVKRTVQKRVLYRPAEEILGAKVFVQ